MTQVYPCKDDTELSPLYPSRGLFLKPIARMNVSVHYPELKQTLSMGLGIGGVASSGKSVSSWDIMERIKTLVSPEEFVSLKVVKNTLEFIRFEGDLENRVILKKILQRLDGKTMKVTGFKEQLKIKTCESKISFPSKYDWDSFFRDAKNMNEMKAGERPDTIHFQNLPVKWFTGDVGGASSGDDKKLLPSERFFKKVWEEFGDVRAVDIPSCDPYRSQMAQATSGIKTFASFTNDNVFEGYVQYKDYISFVKAMDALRGTWIYFQESGHAGKSFVANIKVDFDKSKHLSDESIRKRKVERDKLLEKDKAKKHAEKLSRIEQEVTEKKKHEKEKKDSEKALAKIEYKIAMEERKYLIAQRKLEAIRLMDYLFETVKKQKLLKGNAKGKEHGDDPKKIKEKHGKSHKHNRVISELDAVVDVSRRHRKKHKVKDHKHHRREKNKNEDDDFSSPDDQYTEKTDRIEIESPRRTSRSPVESERRRKPSRSPVEPERNRRTSRSPLDSGRPRRTSHSPYRQEAPTDHHRRVRDVANTLEKPHVSSSVQVVASSVRYLGDWEVKAKSTLSSKVQVSTNYVPVGSEGATSLHQGPHINPAFPMSFYRGRGGPRGRFFRGGPPPFFRGGRGFARGAVHWSGDNPNYPSIPHPSNQSYNEDKAYSNSGSYRGRGRGRGYYHRGGGAGEGYHSDEKDQQIPVITSNGPIVRHNYSYLDDLDRAYEKYFTSITRRNES